MPLGASIDADLADLPDWLAVDQDTRSILVQFGEISGARKVMSAARSAARNKPLVAIQDSPEKAVAVFLGVVNYRRHRRSRPAQIPCSPGQWTGNAVRRVRRAIAMPANTTPRRARLAGSGAAKRPNDASFLSIH